MLPTNRQLSAIKLSVKKEKFHGEFQFKKPYEKVSMEFSDSEFWRLLEDFMKVHEDPMDLLKIHFDEEDSEDVRRKDDILKKLENSLNSRNLKIKRVSLEVSKIDEAARILKHLDSEFLRKIEIKISNSNRKIDIDDVNILLDWKRGKPLKFIFKMDKVFEENLKSINKLLLNWSSFTGVDLIYQDFELDPSTFFDVPFKFEKNGDSENLINFQPNSRFRFAPSLVKLTLSNEKSATVLENPVIMGKIFEHPYFRIFDIQRLRKTSPGIRACVDHLNPETFLDTISIFLRTEEGLTLGNYVNDFQQKWIQYEKSSNPEFLSRLLSDFHLNSKNQKKSMRKFRFNFSYQYQPQISNHRKNSMEQSEAMKTTIETILNPLTSEFLSGFQKILAKRTEALKVKNVVLMSVSPSDIMQILPYLDSESLEVLEIRDPSLYYSMEYNRHNYPESLKIPFDLEEIAKTEQWRNALELDMSCYRISTRIPKMNLTNFAKIYISNVQTITGEDEAFLKEKLLTSSNLKRFIISFENFPDRADLYDHIGHPTRIYTEARKVWYFQ